MNLNKMNGYVYVISYEYSLPYLIVSLTVANILLCYVSMIYLVMVLVIVSLPLMNGYLLTSVTVEYLYGSLILFIFLEILLFIAYFWYYFHNLSYLIVSSRMSMIVVNSSVYFLIAGLILTLLSIYLSSTTINLFLAMSVAEFSNVLDSIYINDYALVSLQLTIISLHLLHLVVGLLFILCELAYPQYYHFIELVWIAIGYIIYLE
jgi:hypothetical protein